MACLAADSDYRISESAEPFFQYGWALDVDSIVYYQELITARYPDSTYLKKRLNDAREALCRDLNQLAEDEYLLGCVTAPIYFELERVNDAIAK